MTGESHTVTVPSNTHMPAHLYIQHLVTLHKHSVNKVGYNKTWRQGYYTALYGIN